ncbi:hypothetical protein CCACVL1_22187 [Corchorus capsularis]|uniref:Uncharacterized protein n=1 Tax=Corchorus capsularis TaxID=210143 RepID=A0A1R3H0U8_COCAP|nr:hypothetical protein CCACVL1_22187 [Corchorus capsularis]
MAHPLGLGRLANQASPSSILNYKVTTWHSADGYFKQA